MTKEKILITSALPYANGPLHFGHIAGAYLPADSYARYRRLMGSNVLYICGSDEYGIAITLSAEISKRSPKEHVDIYHEINKNFFKQLNIAFDHYSRTTWPGHVAPVQEYFRNLYDNGYIEERTTEQLFSEQDQKFLADRYVMGTCPRCGFEEARGDECPKCGASYESTDLKNPRSKLTGSKLILKPTKHWFLRLDLFKDQLKEWIAKKNWKSNVVNFIKSYIDELHPRSITRDMTWGVPVPLPETDGKALYVWFDAPIGYISSTMEWSQLQGDPNLWKEYWFDPETKLVQFVGKDNIPFHASIFPAMTMGQNLPYKLVDELPANEFLNLEGKQFSKSDGWTIDLDEFFKKYTPDQIRYTLAANAPETSDSEFTWKDFQLRCNTDLLGKFGNLINRVLVFAKNHCDAQVPDCKEFETIDREFLEKIQTLAKEASEAYSNFKLRKASQIMMELTQVGNVYFDSKKPWGYSKAQDPQKSKEVMYTTIYCCLECIKVLALISFPIIPTTSEKVWRLLGFNDSLEKIQWHKVLDTQLVVGQKQNAPEILFKRVEDEEITYEMEKLKKMSQEAKKGAQKSQTRVKDLVDIDTFKALDLRVGQILTAEPVIKSKKLLKLQVDIGYETRTIVAGIQESYKPESIIGKKVIVVANLKPATLMGVVSHGMLLAGNLEGKCELASLQEMPPGTVIS